MSRLFVASFSSSFRQTSALLRQGEPLALFCLRRFSGESASEEYFAGMQHRFQQLRNKEHMKKKRKYYKNRSNQRDSHSSDGVPELETIGLVHASDGRKQKDKSLTLKVKTKYSIIAQLQKNNDSLEKSLERKRKELMAAKWSPIRAPNEDRMLVHGKRDEDGEVVEVSTEKVNAAIRKADERIERELKLNLDKSTIHLDFEQLITPKHLLKSSAIGDSKLGSSQLLRSGTQKNGRITAVRRRMRGKSAATLLADASTDIDKDIALTKDGELVLSAVNGANNNSQIASAQSSMPSFVSLTQHLNRFEETGGLESLRKGTESQRNLSRLQQESGSLRKHRQRRRHDANAIDWKRLDEHISVVGWDHFADFINDDANISVATVPGFLQKSPQRRTTLDRPKAKTLAADDAFKLYRVNEEIHIEPFRFETNGNVSVLVNHKHFGFVKKKNAHFPLKLGEFHTGFVHEINHRGRIEVVLEHPNFWSKMLFCQQRIVDVLTYCKGSMEVNDKADSDTISAVFQMSKRNFKRALGMLMKNELVELRREPPSLKLKVRRLSRRVLAGVMAKRMIECRPPWEYGTIAPPLEMIEPEPIKKARAQAAQMAARKSRLRVSPMLAKDKQRNLLDQ